MVIHFSTSKISTSTTSSWWLRGKVIGRGCFGTVNVAVNKSNGDHIFAVKSVNLATCIPPQLDSLENEIRILRSVSSPHVVRFLGDDVTREGTGLFRNLHLEYMPRGTLADIAGQNLEEDMIRRFTRCLVSALKDVHTCGFVHCDVKARNVLLGEEPGSAKLADFGSGLEIQTGNQTGCEARGSPLWMALEVIRGECQGPESDVWSLGCTIIEMVTGKPPWIEDGAEILRTIGFSDELPKLPARLSEIGRNFLEKCLRRDASERWSCDQLLQHPFLLCSALSESPRHVFDWVDSVFKEEEAAVSEHVSESSSSLARERIGNLATSGGVIWESDGWLVVRGSETRQLVPDSSCTEPVTVRNQTSSSYGYQPTWQIVKVKMILCPNKIRYLWWQFCKYVKAKRTDVNALPQWCCCGVPQNTADLAIIVVCSILLYMCCAQRFINKIFYVGNFCSL
ncbi:mitogen-activated protein kinase kinase kinase 18-like [Brassica napus]|uniref:mitogen-activated protein kinase kinase kinase 18-like n=1 Tax=Brassica napus TaxID=3708 RepID=UPI002078BA4A|nr:mitogen-activated protein kinase kinase kinase 18-like [Brassica napus]